MEIDKLLKTVPVIVVLTIVLIRWKYSFHSTKKTFGIQEKYFYCFLVVLLVCAVGIIVIR